MNNDINHTTKVVSLFNDENDVSAAVDPFAEVVAAGDAGDETALERDDAEDAHVQAPVQVAGTEKDFSDLLAEFEAEQAAEENGPAAVDQNYNSVPEAQESEENRVQFASDETPKDPSLPSEEITGSHPASLFDTEASHDSAFDDLLQDSSATTASDPPPPPGPSIDLQSFENGEELDSNSPIKHSPSDPLHVGADVSMQSLFSKDDDWLVDTSMDDSFLEVGSSSQRQSGAKSELPVHSVSSPTDDGNEPVSFDIPQGWYDDDGNWNWYTEEQREQVRQTMLGEGQWNEEPIPQVVEAAPSPALPSTPGRVVMSENAARRIPIPERNPFDHISDPYAPPSQPQTASTSISYVSSPPATASTFQSQSTYDSATGSSSLSQPSPYVPAQAPSYAPQAPPSAPYAPIQQPSPYAPAQAYAPAEGLRSPPLAGPYAPAQPYMPSSTNSRSSLIPPAGPSNVPKQPPVQPKRMPSTAYDPPMLKSKKTVSRSVSAMALSTPGFSNGPAASSQSPPAPPSGPPRRSKTPKFDTISSGLATISDANGPHEELPPPPVPPLPSQRSLPPPRQSVSPANEPPPGPPMRPPSVQSVQSQSRAPTYNSFDPPLRPPSASTTGRASPSMALSPPTAEYEPPRSISRGSQRKSPMFQAKPQFESRPPSRSYTKSAPRMSPPPPMPVVDAQKPLRENTYLSDVPQMPQDHQYVDRTVSDNQKLGTGPHDRGGFGDDLRQEHYLPEHQGDRMSEPRGALSPPPQPPASDSLNSYTQSYDTQVPETSRYAGSNGHTAATAAAAIGPPNGDYMMETTSSGLQFDAYPSEATGASSAETQQPVQQANQPVAQRDTYSPYSVSQVQQAGSDPYAPQSSIYGLSPLPNGNREQGQTFSPPQPQSMSMPSMVQQEPYAPGANTLPSHQATTQPPIRSTQYDPYAPSSYQPAESSFAPQHSSSPSYGSSSGLAPPGLGFFQSNPSAKQDDTYIPLQVLEQKPVSEDPLGRCTLAARSVPIAIFGFGGKLVTAFPGMSESNESKGDGNRAPAYGYASSSGQVWIRPLHEIASSSALRTSDTIFPGPLVLDPATKNAATDKKKRESVVSYLEARADEIEKGLPYLKTSVNSARREVEGKLVLVRLILALMIGEGKLAGSPQVEEAVRTALVNPNSDVSMVAATVTSPLSPTKGAAAMGASYFPGRSTESAKATPAQLAQLSDFLQRGNKLEAVHSAMEAGLWSHALLISSSVDPETWREVISKFIGAELTSNTSGTSAMKASYTLFAGLSTSAVDELMATANITGDPSLDRWREVISAIVFNGKPADLFSLDDIAARLNAGGLIYAAHACHLLSPNSSFADTTPAAYERLIGLTQNPRDDDALIFAEIAEYARSLVSIPKGQEAPFPGLPQLLPYKLQRAWRAAEIGDVDQAQRYCTAIETAAKPGKNQSSPLPVVLLASLEDLTERLTGTPSANPANLLMSGRKGKSGVDKIGSWIEGRLTKFIAGEEEPSDSSVKQVQAKPNTKNTPQGLVGPFSHFSTISPAASGQVTRAQSTVDFPSMNGQLGIPPDSRRTSPAMLQGQWGQPLDVSPSIDNSTSSTSSYGGYAPHDPYAHRRGGSKGSMSEIRRDNSGEDEDESDELINPMSGLNLGPPPDTSRVNYTPQPAPSADEEDDDDLGFGNSSLSRGRTPKPASEDKGDERQKSESAPKQKEDEKAEPSRPTIKESKSSWLGRLWKKEGEGSGPVRAKLGEESSMVFDPELKRWVVKGAKPETAPPPLAPPPRAATISPATGGKASELRSAQSSFAPPPSSLNSSTGSSGPPTRLPRSTTAPTFSETAGGAIKRNRPPLDFILDDPSKPKTGAEPNTTSGPSSMSGGSGPPTRPGSSAPSAGSLAPPPPGLSRSTTGASLDDLLSRPPSKRPGSSAKKSMRNKYVDVFQPGT